MAVPGLNTAAMLAALRTYLRQQSAQIVPTMQAGVRPSSPRPPSDHNNHHVRANHQRQHHGQRRHKPPFSRVAKNRPPHTRPTLPSQDFPPARVLQSVRNVCASTDSQRARTKRHGQPRAGRCPPDTPDQRCQEQTARHAGNQDNRSNLAGQNHLSFHDVCDPRQNCPTQQSWTQERRSPEALEPIMPGSTCFAPFTHPSITGPRSCNTPG